MSKCIYEKKGWILRFLRGEGIERDIERNREREVQYQWYMPMVRVKTGRVYYSVFPTRYSFERILNEFPFVNISPLFITTLSF